MERDPYTTKTLSQKSIGKDTTCWKVYVLQSWKLHWQDPIHLRQKKNSIMIMENQTLNRNITIQEILASQFLLLCRLIHINWNPIYQLYTNFSVKVHFYISATIPYFKYITNIILKIREVIYSIHVAVAFI